MDLHEWQHILTQLTLVAAQIVSTDAVAAAQGKPTPRGLTTAAAVGADIARKLSADLDNGWQRYLASR